ncbi:C-type lectin domain family 4 member K [Biomphalaria glabrata]|nr:C-type lectin domain family 4 member K [Biomphalaria glabrata]
MESPRSKIYRLVCFIFILLGNKSDASVRITALPSEMMVGFTDTLSISCNVSDDETLISITLSKSDNSERNFISVARVVINADAQFIQPMHENLKLEGKINPAGSSYLSLVITSPTSEASGFYNCISVRLNKAGNVVRQNNLTEVREIVPSISDVHREQKKMFDNLQTQIRHLEDKLNNFNETCNKKIDDFVTRNLQNKQILQNNFNLVDQKIMNISEDVKFLRDSNDAFTHAMNLSLDVMFMNKFTYGKSTYLLSRSGVYGFVSAEIACAIYGGYVVEIDTREEYDAIVSSFRSGIKFDSVFLGLTDEGTEGHWFFSFSRRPVTFTLWNTGELQGTGENCAILFRPFGFKMADLMCNDQNRLIHFLCELSP